MNAAHLHLLVNHFPVIGAIFCLALALAAFVRRTRDLELAALWAFVIVAALTVPVYLTGEPAEDALEDVPGVTEAVIEPHEESAEAALVAIEVTGLLALAALVLARGSRAVPRPLLAVVIIAAIVATGMMAWTANLGGQIRHTEIRPGTGTP